MGHRAIVFGAAVFCGLVLAGPPEFELRPAEPVWMPGAADSNSPGEWIDGVFYLFNSNGNPVRTSGPNALELRGARAVLFYDYSQRHLRWIESTWLDPDGVLFAWYHTEVEVCHEENLSAPEIGALVSFDKGATFFDLGIVLQSGDGGDCTAANGYFASGHGDFTVIADREGEYLYFFFGNYGGDPSRQGVAVARMAVADRWEPAGKVWKFDNGAWESEGIGGLVTPVFPVKASWAAWNTDAFWGPSVHFNTKLGRYVMLLNRSCCEAGWPQEGIYLSASGDLSRPFEWSEPVKVMEGGNWYPQVIGLGEGESDKLAGEAPRLFVGGYSEWELYFAGP